MSINGRVRGYTLINGCYVLINEGECLIHSLSVDKKLRHNGFGSSIIKRAENEVIENGYDKVFLYVETSSWMHDWYKRLWYNDTREPCEKGYTKMIKDLNRNDHSQNTKTN